jgi:putative endonuclease
MSEKTDVYWFVYIVECSDGTYYTGISNDVKNRIEKHNTGKGAAYTRGRGPVKLIYSEKLSTRSEASIRESIIKKLSKLQKVKLIRTQ